MSTSGKLSPYTSKYIRVFPISIIPQLVHNFISFAYNQQYIITETGSLVKQNNFLSLPKTNLNSVLLFYFQVSKWIYGMIYLLTATGLSPGGSTVHIYIQTIHRTTQQFGKVRAVPRLGQLYPGKYFILYIEFCINNNI